MRRTLQRLLWKIQDTRDGFIPGLVVLFRAGGSGGTLSRPLRGLLAIFSGTTLILSVFSLFFAWFALPRYSNRWYVAPTMLLLSAPRYLAVNEEEEVRVSLKNEKVTTIQVTLAVRGDDATPMFIEQGGSSIFLSATLQAFEQIERKVNLFLPYDFGGGPSDNTLGKSVDLTLWASIDAKPSVPMAVLPLNVAPIPWPRTLFGASFSMLTGTFLWFVREWWTIMKQALEKTE